MIPIAKIYFSKATDLRKNLAKFLQSSLFAFLIIGSAILSGYGQTLSFPFQMDDRPAILQENSIHVKSPNFDQLAPILLANRPVASLSFAFNFYFGGLNPKGFHFLNIAVHSYSTFLVHLVFLEMTAENNLGTKFSFIPKKESPW